MVNVVVNNGQYKLTIPKDIALAKGWTSDTKLIFIMNSDGEIILKELPNVVEKLIKKRGKSGKKK